jgi:glucose dehydrogenase
MRIIKVLTSFFLLIFTLLSIVLIYDLAYYDPSYLNRNAITFSVNNLNSKKVKKIFIYYDKLYYKLAYKFSKKHQDFWTPEDPQSREQLPKIIKIKSKKDNFAEATKINEIEKNFENWPRSHGGFTSMRFSSLDKININNVKSLDLAWVYNSKDGKRGIQANPVIYEGLIYMPTPGNNIVCLDGVTGKEIWKYKVKKGYHAAKRGLLLWKDKKNNILRLIFTNDDQLITLDAKTGKTVNSFGKNGIIKIGSSAITPTIIDEQLVIGTTRPAIEVYNLYTGKLYWKYYLRKIDKKVFNSRDFKSGNPWGGISSDNKNGLVFLTTGNPLPYSVGVKRPGKNLFANSLIAFDVRNKKMLWYFQETCHDIWNFDIAAPPILTTINKYGARIDVAIAVTKLGNTIILDRFTGEPIFDYEKKIAPVSKFPGEKTCAYQPSFKLPEPFSRNIFTKDDITNLNKASRDHVTSIVEKSNYGFFPTHELNKDTIVYNLGGGAQWTGASIDPYKNILYVTANQIAYTLKVFASYDINKNFEYKIDLGKPLRDLDNYPGTKPPWGTLTALNLNSGKIIWQVPLGYYESLKLSNKNTGTENFGGATATSGNLVFAAGTIDKLIRAFDSSTGKELWSFKLPFIGSAPPSVYEVNGEQYIVVPASGGISLQADRPNLVKQGDAIVAFKIKN